MAASSERFSIAHVTPFPWETPHVVNDYVHHVCSELARAGHRVLILAPSRSPQQVRESRALLRAAKDDPQGLLEDSGQSPRLLAVGEVLDVHGTGRRAGALPIDVARTIEQLLGSLELDFVHVHEPFAPSAASAALRHSRSLNIGSFHSPTEHLLSTQVARRFVETFFGRLDARIASSQATAQLMARHFPGDYSVLLPGIEDDLRAAGRRREGHSGEPFQLLFIEREERAALRLLLRALRHLDCANPWQVTIVSERGESSSTPLRSNLRERVRFISPSESEQAQLFAQSDVIVCSSEGSSPAPQLLLGALAAGTVAVASRLPIYEEILGEGQRGLTFEPRDAVTLAGQLARLIDDPVLRARLSAAAVDFASELTWKRTADSLQEVYRQVAARRHSHGPTPALRRALARRPLIDVDLHMHTDHSHDCATPVEVLLAGARDQGLGAIAVTDHNEISGALEAREKAAESGAHPAVKVIVGEE
ncbi:MAG: glycosyltransferase, partial [Solirubrobacteraceae bacterium]